MPANQRTRLKFEFPSLDFVSDPATVDAFKEAAHLFVKQDDETTKIWAASEDWFLEEWGRDTFISLPGLLLTTGRFGEARQVFTHYAKYEKGGLIPNIIRQEGVLYNTADGSLWLIHALRQYLEVTQDWLFVGQMLPVLKNIIKGYQKGVLYERAGLEHYIGMDETDSLVKSPVQATWMDADPAGDGSAAVTPRAGKCVEINALWYGSIRFVAKVAEHFEGDSSEYNQLANRVRVSFRKKFWNDAQGCLYDYIDGDDERGSQVRPNQIIAISHGGDLLTDEIKENVLSTVARELLTPGGLRTLSSHDPQYVGEYDTSAPMSVKDLAYHQGTIWPWLIGPYCDALRIVMGYQGKSEYEIKQAVSAVVAPLVAFCLDSDTKSLPEVFSGDEPYEPGGTTSQAWSVAEVLRILSSL